MKNYNLLAGLLIGGGVIWAITSYMNAQRERQFQAQLRAQYQNTPAPPRQGAPQSEWQQWMGLVMSLYGDIRGLWEPGGPFYRQEDIIDIVNPPGTGTA
jgi:hypothetical protein